MVRLSIFLSLVSGSLISGALIITVLSLGLYNWWAIGAAAIIGFLLAWPSALIVSRRIKNNDPEWSPHSDPFDHGPIPEPGRKDV